MTALWVIVAVLAALAFFPLALEVRYNRKGLTVFLRVGPVWLTVYPGKKASKKVSPKKREKSTPDKKSGGPLPPVRELFPLLSPTLRAVKKRLSLHICRVWVTVGGEQDPAAAALAYGGIHAFYGVFSSAFLENFRVKEADLRCEMDFSAAETSCLLELGATLRLWQLFAIVLPLLCRFIKLYSERTRYAATKQETR